MTEELLRELQREILNLRTRVTDLERASGLYATNRDLDGPKGNIKVKFDPRGWRGVSHKGRLASTCEPAFLEAYAEALAYMAAHPKPGKDPKYCEYDRADAARARSWARRLRAKGVDGAPADEPAPEAAQGFQAPTFKAPTFQAPSFKPPGFAEPAVDDWTEGEPDGQDDERDSNPHGWNEPADEEDIRW